ncbi:MAG TPA: ATP-dependent 6-phosphofructokinase [Gemmatimonadales bacterium]|jgi:phosphofructokinase-like protein|nr:ATP-dependent 6-phosphofructokinase [Gemmatimonadales bacterium]
MRIALSTGGGDAPGLNAVIRAVVLSASQRGWETFGIRSGYDGLFAPQQVGPRERRQDDTAPGLIPLGPADVRGITHLGGTILGTTTRGNPFQWLTRRDDGIMCEIDRSDDVVAAFRARGLDALVAIGGDGSLRIAYELFRKGIPVVGVPKTIDNDVVGTESSFGFDTAVSTATDALDRIHTTAESHDRVFVVELMGRYAGWIALHSGLSGSADVILIPEIPFDIEKVCEKILERERRGRRFSIVVAAEGARPKGGSIVYREQAALGRPERLGGIAEEVAREIAERTGKETRSVVLGHLQRGGSPTTFDRLLALRFGSAAVRAISDGEFGCCVVYTPPTVGRIALVDIIGKSKLVPLDSGIIMTARNLGISLGD